MADDEKVVERLRDLLGIEQGEETKTTVPAKFKDIVEKIEKMSVLELNELVKFFEKKFGVSAAAVAVAAAAVGVVVGVVTFEEAAVMRPPTSR